MTPHTDQKARLEALSDKVRMGTPIEVHEALEVIEYQETLRQERDKSLLRRLARWLTWK